MPPVPRNHFTNATSSARWCCISKTTIRASSRDLAKSTPPAFPIFSSRSFREVQREQQQLAHSPRILGKPRDLDDSRGIRRAAPARCVVRPGQHSPSELTAGIRGSRVRVFGGGRFDVLSGHGGVFDLVYARLPV